MKTIYQNKSGFTMVEILVAVIIIISLVTMAIPLYDRAIEKSRIGEASVTLKRMGESKLRVMNNRDMANYTEDAFQMNDLDMTVPISADWYYGLYNSAYPNAVCAKRKRGKNANKVVLLYLGEAGADYCNCSSSSSSSSICEAYCNEGEKLFCRQATGGSCETYGMSSMSFPTSCSNGR